MLRIVIALSVVSLLVSAQVQSNSNSLGASVPQACNNGYYWTTQSCMPCPAVANGVCTCSTASACTSITCNSNFVLDTLKTTCVAQITCPANCLTCGQGTDSVLCYTCAANYGLIGNMCVQNSNCQQVNLNTGICSTCINGYYLNLDFQFTGTNQNVGENYWLAYSGFSQCSKCPDYCQKCNSGTTCDTCNQGYFWQLSTNSAQGACTQCATGCAQCTSPAVKDCVQNGCLPNYFQDSVTMACATCTVPNCISCLDKAKCQTCSSGQTVKADGTACLSPPVQNCGAGCTSCGANNKCSACSIGYYFNSNLLTCTACGTGCSACSPSSTGMSCTACLDTYALKSSTVTLGTCVSCAAQNTAYLRCTSNAPASAANLLFTPTQCADSYFLFSGTCVAYATPNTCMTIKSGSANACQTCLAGMQNTINQNCQTPPANCKTFAASTSGTSIVCSECNSAAYYINSDASACTPCSSGCTTCTSATLCSGCISGYYINGNTCATCTSVVNNCATCTSTVCSGCNAGYYLTSATPAACNSCPDYCQTCSSPGNTCTTCEVGFVLQNGGCVSLDQANCASSSASGCTTCLYGYYLKQNRCLQCLNYMGGTVCRQNSTPI